MLLRKWRTNSKQLDLLWRQEGVERESSETSATDLRPPIKVFRTRLGFRKGLIYFDPKDLLKFMSRRTESKRFILSVVGRIFDPIGILGPIVIKLKCLLQDLWTLGVDWDSELPPKLRHKWQQWSSEAEGLTEIKIPRFYLGDVDQELSSVDIHCFSDAGKLAKQVSSCLKFNANIYYWTDSLISYYWIRGNSSAFKPYIKNRVQEIQLLSDTSQWGHCPGKNNPADLLSRGTSAVKLAQNELWWNGPPWLKLTPDHWPNRHRDILDSELCSEELEYRSSVHEAVTQQRESLVDINRFSSLKKLLKVTAWVSRFVNNARIVNKSMNFYITADEIQNAEYFWLKYVQSEFYSSEILALKRNEQLRCSSEIKSLVPYLDEDNLLRITGRLLEADLSFGEKHPVILPRHCKFTELLVIREHERIGHCGVSATLLNFEKIIGYLKLSTLDKEVESLIKTESLEDEILTREEYRDKFIIWKIRAERYIGTVSSITFQNLVENQPQNKTPLNNTVSSVLTNQQRLPKLALESFSSKDMSSFPRFWARFKSAVHDNSNLNDVDKFSYLKSVVTSDAELAIRAELRRFWEIESLGIRDNDSVSLGNGDEEILSEFDKSVCFVDGRYRVSLPWKPGMREVLQNNKTVARKRFEGLVRRFKCDHELFCEYKDVIDNYVREGIVGRTSCDSLSDSQGFYLPHHAVIRSDKTTNRLRIVFDGSAHEDGHSSLNQSFYTGPNLHSNMLELLLRFRKNPVAFTADVKSAFLQIELDLRDRDFTRFFWTDNLNNNPYVLNFARVLFGLRPSPYLLAATLKHHFRKYKEQYPHTFDLLNSSIYVDDFICGRNDVLDALRTTLECLQIFSDASMLLRKWRTNSKQLDLLWRQEGVERESSETSATDLRPPIKVLELAWDSEKDLIYFDPKDLLKFMSRRTESKRFILSVVGRIFDPIGILGPIVIKLKCLLQDLWTLGVDWDSELPPKLRHKWQQWSSEAEGLTEIKIPRFYLGDVDQELSSVDIHCFSDAGKLAKQVSSCLKFNANIYYWTDSLISYYWIRGDSSAFKPYIKNRVQEIQLLSDTSQWGHCPGKNNPADLLSRGTSAVKLAQNELWWNGPPWLKLTPDHWPNRHRDILDSELCSEELEYRSSVHEAVTQQRESLVDINRFSSLKKLLKVTAWVSRFVNNARIVNKSMNFYITADEIQNAEYFWLKYVQSEFYSSEILALKRNEQLRCSSEIKSLVPYLDEDNLLRITGRLLEADLSFGEKHPVILPRHCKFTELLVIREHERIGHCGVSATLLNFEKIIGYLKVVS
ncbi:integrase catalytic domain-containing protein [Trichonephila clavata]|uniref:Integrase catalytic domain-containing protein n=1 Tax=Trichonephila clavata TaxID=2740835 RepID=A0A8X6JQF7_TRICU|nr:integrase catalytic domain-containing protein [Trichonephila clavata]